MRVLVTGVTGFLGGRLAHRLTEAGHQVRGFVRNPAAWNDRPDGSEIEVGDIRDPAAVSEAARACDVIVHAAALVKMWVRDSRDFDRINVEGLGHVMQAAREHEAKLVYVSSFVALGPTDGAVHDEESPRSTTEFNNDYERTKWLADQLARKSEGGGALPVRLYPGVIYGPGALTAGNHVVQLLLQHARGKLPGILGKGDLRQCFSYVGDVVEGILAAVERAEPGSAYILGGENKTALELFDAFQQASGVAPPTRHIPFGLAALIGKLQRWRAILTGIEPELTDEVVGIYRHEWSYSSDRAVRELGYPVTTLAQGLAETVRWLRAGGHLASGR